MKFFIQNLYFFLNISHLITTLDVNISSRSIFQLLNKTDLVKRVQIHGSKEKFDYHADRQEVSGCWIWVIHCMQARKYQREGSTLALKPRADVSRSPNRGISGQTKKTDVLQNFWKKIYGKTSANAQKSVVKYTIPKIISTMRFYQMPRIQDLTFSHWNRNFK